MKRPWKCLVPLAMLLLVVGAPKNSGAQQNVIWSEPFNISRTATSSSHPAIVTDDYGFVHIFWSEDMDGPELEEDQLITPGDTIMYRRWDGQSWTEPLDILAVASDTLADFLAATIDADNRIHLVWTGLTELYYSSAPATAAQQVRAWTTPQVIAPDSARTRYEIDVAVDSEGVVHAVFATRGETPGIYHAFRRPGQTAWSPAVRISSALRPIESAFKDVRLVIDGRDRLHAVWATSNDTGFSQAVYYVRAEEPLGGWEPTVTLSDAAGETAFTGWPNLLAYAPDNLLLIYVGEDGNGRLEHLSADGGRTWSAPNPVLPDMMGVNGFLVPLVDAAGQLHLVINMRPFESQRTGIYYAPRIANGWEPINPVAIEAPFGPTAHYTDATVRLGNEIHAVWTQARGGEIWYARGTIDDVTPLPVVPAPEPVPPTAVAVEDEANASVATQAVTSDNPAPLPPELMEAPVIAVSIWQQLAFIILPVAFLLAGILLWQLRRR